MCLRVTGDTNSFRAEISTCLPIAYCVTLFTMHTVFGSVAPFLFIIS